MGISSQHRWGQGQLIPRQAPPDHLTDRRCNFWTGSFELNHSLLGRNSTQMFTSLVYFTRWSTRDSILRPSSRLDWIFAGSRLTISRSITSKPIRMIADGSVAGIGIPIHTTHAYTSINHQLQQRSPTCHCLRAIRWMSIRLYLMLLRGVSNRFVSNERSPDSWFTEEGSSLLHSICPTHWRLMGH
jgi:hypothetical protein